MNKVYSLLGLAARSRNVVSGELSTEKAVKTGSAELVIISTDASGNTNKMFRNMCDFYNVPFFQYGTKEELGHAMGKEMRSSLAVTDNGFAESIKKHLKASEEYNGGSEHGENKST
ncbi:L7Ae/L30e/S12e/Gadd45 family ribosomal protein [Kineothrix sp. MB12-C1]|uniref:L7Ae/L30e/S12e/Gadd45 family ribosomal protein n=1 Tax=Kineothrix sp. MB12-C1 TaxID=3070215 RepID=UPI0027D206BC|nr:ribosomal L7Ae/L30e/S12e/Gadd45 family protein [Kineothrix sp. MB12-C1]WMC92959.1 ribosomal L7Ae/L30e/S12e/Gadd45 family protein [Kineothrix sp. MB12-C1]